MGHSKPAGENSITEAEKLRASLAKLEQVRRELATRKGTADGNLDKVWHEWERTFDATKDSIMVVDNALKIVQANLATSRLLRKPLDDVVGKTCWQVIHGTQKPPKQCALQKAQHSKQREAAQLYVPGRDIWIEVAVDPILDEQGKITKTVHIMRDISDRKKAEEALRESEEKYREIVELAPDGITTVDLKGTITSCNSALLQKTGYRRDDFVGKHISRIPTARIQDMPKYLKMFGALLLGKVPKPFEFRWIHKDGTQHWGELRVSIMKRNDKTTGFQAITRDITERRRAEEAYRTLVDHSLQGLAIFQEGRIVFANQAMAEITGYAVEQMLAMSPQQVQAFVHPEDRELVWNRHTQRLQGKAPPERYELRGIRKDSSVCWLEIHASRIEYQGKPAIQAAYVDITERKRVDSLMCAERDLAIALSSATNLDAALRLCVEAAINASGVDCGGVCLFNEATGNFELACSKGLGKDFVESERVFGRNSPAGKLLLNGVPVYSHHEKLPKHETEYREDLKAVAIIPIRHRGKVLASLNVASHRLDEVPVWSRSALEVIAAQVGGAVARLRAEQGLRESEQRYRDLFENAGEGIVTVDLDGRITGANRLVEEYGFNREKLMGRKLFDFVPEYDKARAVSDFQALLAGSRVQGEMDVITTKGIRAVEYSDAPIVRAGAVIGAQAILTDITERKNAEHLLRKERDKAQTYLDIAGVMLVAIDSEQRVGLINRKGCEILGYREEEIIAKNWFDNFLPEGIRDEVKTVFEGVMAGEADAPEYYENPILTKSGDERLIAWHNTILRDEKRQVVATLSSGEDITDRKKTERELQRTQQEKTGILDNMLEHVVYRDLEMKVLWANRAAAKSIGLAPEQLAGRYCYEIWHQRSAPCVVCPAKLAMRSGQGEEMQVTTPDGRIWFIRAYPIRDANGQTIGLASTTLEITERKKADEALRESEEKFRGIFDHANDGIIYLDSTGKILDVNAKSIQMFGGAKQEVVGKHFTKLGIFTADDIRTLMSNFEAIITGEEATVTIPLKNKKGQQIVLECSASVTQEHGPPARILVIARDITERTKAEEQIQKLAKFPAEDPYPVLRISGHGTVIYGNKASLPLLKAWRCRVGWPLPDPWLSFVLDALSSGQSQQTEAECGRRSFSLTFAPVVQSNYVNVYGLDTTERKEAEEALRESRDYLERLTNSMWDAVFSVKMPERIIEWVNDSFRVIGYEPDDCIGRTTEFLYPDESEFLDFGNKLKRAIAAGEDVLHAEQLLRRKNGEIFPAEITTTYFKEKGKVIRVTSIVRDVTKRKEAEQKLLEYQAQLKSLASQLTLTEEHERRRIATELHDRISQSLVISKIKLESLRKSTSHKRLIGALDQVCATLDRAMADTRDLTFDLSCPTLYELGLEAAISEWLIEEVENKHQIRTEFEDDGQPKPLDDDVRALLFRDVRELLVNVVNHARASKVRVSIERVGGRIRVTLEDDGVGFDTAKLTAAGTGRKGFGLFSIRERLQQFGGHIDIDSSPGNGCKVMMTAPLK